MTVVGEQGWLINDPVLHLRVRGARDTSSIYELPAIAREITIGAGADRAIRLIDPSNMVSRHHAVLRRDGHKWTAHDDDSKNKIKLDGESRITFDLAPGVELGVGSIVLVAESAKLVHLRGLLDRWLGWSADRYLEIDRALRALRYAATLRSVLVLRGEGDLAFLARRLHLQMLGVDRSFVTAGADQDGLAALHEASEGTLCVDATHAPSRWNEVVRGIVDESFKARLVLYARPGARSDAAIAQLTGTKLAVGGIEIPPLALRGHELARVLREYTVEAAADLGAVLDKVRDADFERLLAWRWSGLDDIANDAYRLVALRQWGVTEGGPRLGLTHGALSRWARRRKLATFSPDDGAE